MAGSSPPGRRAESANGGAAVTIAEIAHDAGVSVSTVSKVLNGRRDVSATTRARVQALLADTGYRRRGAGPRHKVGLVDFVITELA
ncbi:MAG TPA: LacI family DNA-binding transcriptional regulator, partial [Actinopolymorphaceae bacterium]|nr:LacI family DNA-binding transcriptional regulator [Actinopolymorphaceae bacterium]